MVLAAVLFVFGFLLSGIALAVEDSQEEKACQAIESIIRTLKEGQKNTGSLDCSNATDHRPHVTLSFAQSLEGRLSVFENESSQQTKANYGISGQESLLMTHAVRSIHDGILVGGKTLSIDNPRLNNRLWNIGDGRQPRPIVLDPSLRHIRQLSSSKRRAKRLLVFCSRRAASCAGVDTIHLDDCTLVPCNVLPNGHLDLCEVLKMLKRDFGICSIMVEGGPSILTSFLEQGLFDSLCITIAAAFLGPGVGIAPKLPINLIPDGVLVKTLGNDCIITMNIKRNT